jgi:hypothetical protein
MSENLFTQRKPLTEILEVPSTVTSVYSMVQHIWDGSDEPEQKEARKRNRVRLGTVEEYFLDPVRSYLETFLQDVADGEGQGYWILAHFGVGKSHLMAVEAILAIGGEQLWDIVKRKEDEVKHLGPGARLDRFRKAICSKKIFPIIFTLEGKGGGGTENRLVDFVLTEARNVFEDRTGKPLAVTPAHHLAEWYLREGLRDFETSLKAFIGNKRLMDELPKFDSYNALMTALHDPVAVEDAATVLRAFLRQKQVRIETKTEPVELLESAFNHILSSGYDGILVVMDEMSEYMNRTKYGNDDEDCLLTLSSVLAKGKRMPLWTIVAAQAQYQKQNKIVGPDRMREELLDHKPERFRNIVINRCRHYKIVKGKSLAPETHNYYVGYKETIPWVRTVDEEQFQECFPFPPEAVQVIQAISSRLTGTRSTISFLHSSLQNTFTRDSKWNDLIPLYRVFTELMTYEESKSNSASGTISVKTIFKDATAALESAQKKLGKIETGLIGKKRGKQRAERILNTLFLYRIAGFGSLTPTQLLDAVCDLKGDDGMDIQVGHYEALLEEMKSELRGQIRYVDGKCEFVPKETGEFDDVVSQAAEVLRKDNVVFGNYFDKLLEYSQDIPSPFSQYRGNSLVKTEVVWHGQERTGAVGFRDLTFKGKAPTPDTSGSEHDFVIVISRRPVSNVEAKEYLKTDPKNPDPRVIVWVPAALTPEQKSTLVNLLAYLKVEDDHPGTKYAKDARSSFQLQSQTGFDLLKQVYQQGHVRTSRKTLSIDWTGGLDGALERMAGDALDDCYKAAEIDTKPRRFGPNEAVKLINGLVKLGKAVPVSDSLHSAVENFAEPLKLVRSPNVETLDPSDSEPYTTIREFAESKAGHPLPLTVFYNEFTGWQPDEGAKSWGLTRRMVDIFLLAMVRQGIVKINLKKGGVIDRTSIADTDFKPETLRSFESVELPKALIDWEPFSRFLEILAGKSSGSYGPKYDQVTAHEALQNLRNLWIPAEKMESLLNRVSELFRDLGQKDPYDDLLLFWMDFFASTLQGTNDDEVFDEFKGILLAALEHEAPEEITEDDKKKVSKCWKELQALQQHFDDQASIVRCAGSYAKVEVPDVKEYKSLEKSISKLETLVNQASEFVVNPDRTNAELRPALERVWQEHDGPFQHGVHGVNDSLKDLTEAIEVASSSTEFVVLDILSEGLPEASHLLEQGKAEISSAKKEMFQPLVTGDDLKRRLRLRASIVTSSNTELHLKDLRPLSDRLKGIAQSAEEVPGAALEKTAEFFLDNALRDKLNNHREKKVIEELLATGSAKETVSFLLKLTKDQLQELAKTLSAVLKGIEFASVKMSDFKPSQTVLWGDEEVKKIVSEFEGFLKGKGEGKIIKIT